MTDPEFVGITGSWPVVLGDQHVMMDLPPGLQVGDLMLAVGRATDFNPWLDPAGWNISRSWTGPEGADVTTLVLPGIYWKVATQADVDLSFIYFLGAIIAYRGVNQVLEAGDTVSQAGIVVQFESVLVTGNLTSVGFQNRGPTLGTMNVPPWYIKDGVTFVGSSGVQVRDYYAYGWLFGCCHKPHSSGPVTEYMTLAGISAPFSSGEAVWGFERAVFVLASTGGPRGLTMFM